MAAAEAAGELGEAVAAHHDIETAVFAGHDEPRRQRAIIAVQKGDRRPLHRDDAEIDGHAAAVIGHGAGLGGDEIGRDRQVLDGEADPVGLVGPEIGQEQPARGVRGAGLAIVEIDPDIRKARQVDEAEGPADPPGQAEAAVDHGEAAIDAEAEPVVA
jgi:hypothetical protein